MNTYDIIMYSARFFGSLVPLISHLMKALCHFFQEDMIFLNDITEQSRPILAGFPVCVNMSKFRKKIG